MIRQQTQNLAIANQKIDQYGSELHSLEINLIQQNKTGAIAPELYNKKLQSLAKIKQLQFDLKLLVREEQESHKSTSNTGLPSLNWDSKLELRIFNESIEQKWQQMKILYENLEKIWHWSQQALLGKGNWIISTFRLAKLKRLKESITQAQKTLEREAEQFEQAKNILCKESSLPNKYRTNIDMMLRLYNKIEQKNRRICELQTIYQQELQKSKDMQRWLTQETKLKYPVSNSMKTPTIKALTKATETSQKFHKESFQRIEENINSISQFVDQQLSYSPSENQPSFNNSRISALAPIKKKLIGQIANRRN